MAMRKRRYTGDGGSRRARIRRPPARNDASRRATILAAELGEQVVRTRRRRRLTQRALGARIGISQARVAQLEAGRGGGAPIVVWVAMGEALGRTFTAMFGRDLQEEPTDSGHLRIRELVLRLSRPAGYAGTFELTTRRADPSRSVDVGLLDRKRRRMVLVECWNEFRDLGAAVRSSDRKRAEAEALAAALGGDDGPYDIGNCWVVRATARNRDLLARYPHIFDARFPGSSVGWLRALTVGDDFPREPGLLWCDPGATYLMARRRPRLAEGVRRS